MLDCLSFNKDEETTHSPTFLNQYLKPYLRISEPIMSVKVKLCSVM